MYDLLIKNGTLVIKDGMFQADVAVKYEKYAAFVKPGEDIAAQRTIDAAGMLVFPGIIDCHAHLNEPGYEYREDFETGTRAAASAGCTCLIDMPLNNRPALTDKEAFACKRNVHFRNPILNLRCGAELWEHMMKMECVHRQIWTS